MPSKKFIFIADGNNERTIQAEMGTDGISQTIDSDPCWIKIKILL